MKKFKRFKNLLGLSFLIILSVLSLSSCKHFESQPEPPQYPVYKFMRTRNVADSYFYEEDEQGNQTRIYIRNIPISTNDQTKIFIGTHLKGFLDINRYERDMDDWIPKHCKD